MKSTKSAYFLTGKVWITLDQRNEFTVSNNYSHICFNVDKNNYNDYVKNLKINDIKEWKINDTEGDSLYVLDDSENKLEIHFSGIEERIKYGKENWGNNVKWFV